MPALVTDRRGEPGPGLHAICLGISAYPHLVGGADERAWHHGMRQLSATARTAAALAAWLRTASGLAVPLKSLRVLLSPSPEEQQLASVAGRALAERSAVEEELLEWRADCSVDPDDVALFFFAGHGVQRTPSGPLLLLREFGADAGNPLRNALDLQNLYQGMAPSPATPNVARTQLWFVDCCRDAPAEIALQQNSGASELFALQLPELDDRCAPIFYAALPGAPAYSITGESSIFGRALLECLEGGAGRKDRGGADAWVVSVESLISSVQKVARRIAAERGGEQQVLTSGLTPRLETRLRTLPSVPAARVTLRVLPDGAEEELEASCIDDGTAIALPRPLKPNPYEDQWPAGFYRIALARQEGRASSPIHVVEPPEFEWKGQR